MGDIARIAGVSTATVSRLFHSPELVKPATRARIEQVLAEHEYVYDVHAAEFSRRTSSVFGLIVATMKSSIHAEVIHGIQSKIGGTSYSLIIGNTDYNVEQEKKLFTLFRQRRLAGIIIVGYHPEIQPIARAVQTQGIPVVVIWEILPDDDCNYVGFDNFKAAHTMTTYLAGLGHRRIAIIMGPYSKETRVKNRFAGFRAALQERGLPFLPEYAIEKEPTLVDGREAMERLLRLSERPTAVFAASDALAMGALAAARNRGLRVPEDISVAGFDDVDFASFCAPPLTTIRVPAFEMGQTAMAVLLDWVEGRSSRIQGYCLDTTLVIRDSCGPPRDPAPGETGAD
jgi:DNA-binding LacI/PurR family transcriptional regulator